jgi:hypothetical protein
MDLKNKGLQTEARNPNFKSYDKGNQILIVFKAFATETPKTMLQVSIETNILRANICRYKRMFEKNNTLQVVKKGICPISKHRACFLSTNKDLVKKDTQLILF